MTNVEWRSSLGASIGNLGFSDKLQRMGILFISIPCPIKKIRKASTPIPVIALNSSCINLSFHFNPMKNNKPLFNLFFLLLPVFSYGQEEKIDSAAIEHERIRWNKSLTRDTTYKFNKEANTLVVETVKGLKPGKALDLGMGQGRNSLFLAKNGWSVTGVDIADEAVAFALKRAKESNVSIDAHVTPMETFDFGTNQWDLVVHVYEGCFEPARVSKIENALKPGGVLVFEFFHREAGIKMKRPTFGCERNSIKTAIDRSGGFKILHYTEEVGIADYGLKKYKMVKLVALKK